MDMSTQDIIARLFGRPGQRPKPLPRATVEHDSVDKMQFGNYTDDSPRFRRIAVEDAPQIAPDIQDPPSPDFTTAAPEEIKEWQTVVRENEAKRARAPEYDAWSDLTKDIFYSYHHREHPEVLPLNEVDPAVSHHAKIASKMMAEPDHESARNLTRDNAAASAIATMAASRALREALENELIEQARQSEEFEQARDKAESQMDALENLRVEAREQHQQQGAVDPQLVQQIREAVKAKQQAQQQAAQIAAQSPKGFDKAAHDAVVAAAKAGADAAENAANMPSFGQGFGEGEPRYESPEQALSIADMWANNPTLRQVSELYGRLDKHMRFQRAKRTVGGQDEIVDLKFGDDLRRVLPSELSALADEDFEDDFYMRYLASEIVVYDTVGEENAGRGPIVLVCDESGSMSGDKNVWAKAIACCLLNIARREKRDFAYVGFGSAHQMYSIMFQAKKQLNANDIVEMASHFYGGGTAPLGGVTEAKRIMENAIEFKKADIVLVGDGDASFGPEDKMIRDTLGSRGVRFHGIGIPSSFRYLVDYCGEEMVVGVHQFELENPSEATAHLATHIS